MPTLPIRHRHRPPRARIAIALHDIEPATFHRAALIRDWLDDHGVHRVTLLVIPARDLHPLGERSPGMAAWLAERAAAGDAIAQHGFRHERAAYGALAGRMPLGGQRSRAAEFRGLDGEEARRAVDAGWRVLKLAGVEPSGFVAPAYAYTPELRQILPRRFRWWAGLWRLRRPLASAGVERERLIAPAWGMGAESRLGRALSPALIRLGSTSGAGVLRLDVHPSDLAHPRRVMALEYALRRSARRRDAITYDELLAGRGTSARVRAAQRAPKLLSR
jgi:predicted deacetylase